MTLRLCILSYLTWYFGVMVIGMWTVVYCHNELFFLLNIAVIRRFGVAIVHHRNYPVICLFSYQWKNNDCRRISIVIHVVTVTFRRDTPDVLKLMQIRSICVVVNVYAQIFTAQLQMSENRDPENKGGYWTGLKRRNTGDTTKKTGRSRRSVIVFMYFVVLILCPTQSQCLFSGSWYSDICCWYLAAMGI